MPKREDFPLGGRRRKSERQQADREEAIRRGRLDRVAAALERQFRPRERSLRSWQSALTSGRAPFPRGPGAKDGD